MIYEHVSLRCAKPGENASTHHVGELSPLDEDASRASVFYSVANDIGDDRLDLGTIAQESRRRSRRVLDDLERQASLLDLRPVHADRLLNRPRKIEGVLREEDLSWFRSLRELEKVIDDVNEGARGGVRVGQVTPNFGCEVGVEGELKVAGERKFSDDPRTGQSTSTHSMI